MVVTAENNINIIISKYATTGDGILTAIKITEAMIESKTTLAKMREPLIILPQITKSVGVSDKGAVMNNPRVKDEAEAIAKSLGRDGRIVLRPSGTEPVLRVMVEAQSEAECREYIDRMVRAIREAEGK